MPSPPTCVARHDVFFGLCSFSATTAFRVESSELGGTTAGVADCGVPPCATTVNGSCCVEVEVLSSCVLRLYMTIYIVNMYKRSRNNKTADPLCGCFLEQRPENVYA